MLEEKMDQRKMCLESFTRASFHALLKGLRDKGYVIDGQKVLEIPFSSMQIERLDQEMFDQLCDLFGVDCELRVRSTGKFFDSQGAFYIVYDTSCHDYESAQRILAKYVDGLPGPISD